MSNYKPLAIGHASDKKCLKRWVKIESRQRSQNIEISEDILAISLLQWLQSITGISNVQDMSFKNVSVQHQNDCLRHFMG